MRRTIQVRALIAALALLLLSSALAPAQDVLTPIRVNGVELHYLERGRGVPVVFVHGGLTDYREWGAQVEPFSQYYRVISYSRRYNYPNSNPEIRPDHSAIIEAEDLAALIMELKLGPVHVVGASYGAYTALFLAARHPEMVRSLVLAEPPVHRWVKDVPGGDAVFAEFMTNCWEAAAQAFRQGNEEQALRVSVDYFIGKGTFDQLPQEVLAMLEQNVREWKALTTSQDAFPLLQREDAAGIKAPTLMLTGGRTLRIHQLVNDELERLLPNGERLRIPEATHEMWDEYPELCRDAALKFLARHP
jgi:non-heme chloroperoxidase